MKLQPFGERIVVKRIAKDVSRGGIILPDDAKKTSLVGEVVEVGENVGYVNVGDYVLFDRYSGREMPHGDEELEAKYKGCLIINEPDLLGKILKEN